MAVAAPHRADPEHGRASLEPKRVARSSPGAGAQSTSARPSARSQRQHARTLGARDAVPGKSAAGAPGPRAHRAPWPRLTSRARATSTWPAPQSAAALTSFVGRRRELRVLRRLVLSTRLVTVTGAAGIGKTRLAVEAARGLLRHFPDGVWLIELASVEPALVPNALAAALRVPEEPDHRRCSPSSPASRIVDCCWCWTTANTWSRRARSW